MRGTDITDVIRVGVVIVIALISVVSKLTKATKGPPKPAAPESDQARRVREDILRKIAERKASGMPSKPAAPANQPSERRLASPVSAPRPVSSDSANPLEDLLRERIRRREAEESRRAAAFQAARDAEAAEEAVATSPAPVAAVPKPKTQFKDVDSGVQAQAAGLLADDLSDPDRIRRAFVLSEILAPPLALR